MSKHHRLRASKDFTTAVRNGRRVGSRTLVVHFLAADTNFDGDSDQSARIGFVVSRAVGGSVTRSRVARRLRHVARNHVEQLPEGSLTVVRALPASRNASSGDLERDLSFTLTKLGVLSAGDAA
ncbi:MAG: ribonuclease P protein component [Candidatus Nanopelagicales bacterium]